MRGNADIAVGWDGEKIYQCVFVDITRQKEKELEAQEHARLVENLYNSIPCGIVQLLVDENGIQITNYNETASKIYGFVNAKEFYKVLEQKDKDEVKEKIFKTIKTGKSSKLNIKLWKRV